jgi:hypothetical protein
MVQRYDQRFSQPEYIIRRRMPVLLGTAIEPAFHL